MNNCKMSIITSILFILVISMGISCNKSQLSERERYCEEFHNRYNGFAEANTNFRDFETPALYVLKEAGFKLYLSTYDEECYRPSSLYIGPLPNSLEDTIYLEYGGNIPGISSTPTVYYVERDYDYELANYWIPDSAKLNNWIYLSEINDSAKVIRGTFSFSLVKKRGWVHNNKDTIYFKDGVFEAIQSPDQK